MVCENCEHDDVTIKLTASKLDGEVVDQVCLCDNCAEAISFDGRVFSEVE